MKKYCCLSSKLFGCVVPERFFGARLENGREAGGIDCNKIFIRNVTQHGNESMRNILVFQLHFVFSVYKCEHR